MKITKISILLLALSLNFVACSSSDDAVEETPDMEQPGGEEPDGGNSGNDGNTNPVGSTVSLVGINRSIHNTIKDASGTTISHQHILDKGPFDFKITGDNSAYNYELKLTGKVLKETYNVPLKKVAGSGANARIYNPVLEIFMEPDEYNVQLLEKETDKLFTINGLFNLPYTIINNDANYNGGEMQIINETSSTGGFTFEELSTLNLNANGRFKVRNISQKLGDRVQLEIYKLDGTLLQSLQTVSVSKGLSEILFYEFSKSNIATINTTGDYLFRLVEQPNNIVPDLLLKRTELKKINVIARSGK